MVLIVVEPEFLKFMFCVGMVFGCALILWAWLAIEINKSKRDKLSERLAYLEGVVADSLKGKR